MYGIPLGVPAGLTRISPAARHLATVLNIFAWLAMHSRIEKGHRLDR